MRLREVLIETGKAPLEQKMENIRTMLFWGLLLAALAGVAAPSFDKVPDEARIALRGTRGKPTRTGLVFVNGHFLKPPYTVARYGTAIFVNNVQVTDQVVSWRSFLATQPGAAPAAAPAPAPAAPAKKASAIDELCDDARAPAAQAAAEPAPSAGGSGKFEMHEQAKGLLKRINDHRTALNRRLRNGETCFFGKSYARVDVPQRLSRDLLGVLPEAMRDAADGADLYNRMRARGFVFLSAPLCAELIENRADYTELVERRNKIKEEEDLQKMLNGRQGTTP